ncbi:MAG: helix-turn-helix transcriptional regulator [Spirochaetes bacterium]|nr:helix-turn-helix transcriptional regulator [Spirochaetota bacterium]
MELLASYDRRLWHTGNLDELDAWLGRALEEVRRSISSMTGPANRAAAFISRSFSTAPDLGEIARAAGASPGHLCRVFRRELRCSVIEYRDRLRIERAAELLRTTDLKVYEIAEQLGFGSVESFSKTFKRKTGSSPHHFGRGQREQGKTPPGVHP